MCVYRFMTSIQRASTVQLSVACLAIKYYCTLYHTQHNILKNIYLTCIMCCDHYKFIWNFSLSKIRRWDSFQNLYWSSCKLLLLLAYRNENVFFLDGLSKNNAKPPHCCLHLIMMRRFEYVGDPESYTSGSVATGRASLAGQVKG